MKTLTKTLFASALTAIVLTSSAFTSLAVHADKKPVAVVVPVTYNKIQVHGNVNVILVQNNKEGVLVDDNFDAAKTTIQQKGYTLIISSTEINPVTVKISVKDLQRIDVSGISSVKTKGDFKLDYLQVFVSNSATADIKASISSLYTVIKDAADLKLSGSANEHTFLADNTASADLKDFVCRKENLTNESIELISMNNVITAK